MSIMFPTIFALGLDGLDDEKRKLGSSLLVMSIIGGAILTAIMGATSDAFGIYWAMAVPLFCFAIILTFALRSSSEARAPLIMARLCFALDLKDNPELIAEYERWHQADRIWPDILQSLRSSGIEEAEIFRTHDRLVLVLEVPADFSLDAKAAADAANERVVAWETMMWKYQKATPVGAPRREMGSHAAHLFAAWDIGRPTTEAG